MNKLKLLPIFLIAVLLFSCGKKDSAVTTTQTGPLGSTFPQVLNTIITPAILDTLKSHGALIYDGLTPPTINGIYLLQPLFCTFDNSGNQRTGTIFDDYKYKFSNQDNKLFTIRVDYEDTSHPGTDNGKDSSATYLSGNADLFTVFAQTSGITNGISYTALQIISGEIVAGGLKNPQLIEYLVSKTGDTDNTLLEKTGSTRIFVDQDGQADSQTTFSVIAPAGPQIENSNQWAVHKENNDVHKVYSIH